MCELPLATFSGKFGDILWSMATLKALSERDHTRYDFACMPAYRPLLPLLRQQSYICHADPVDDWHCTGSPYGDQPWQPPRWIETGRKYVQHLTYQTNPIFGQETLVDFIARQAAVSPSFPFLTIPPDGYIWASRKLRVAVGFSAADQPVKTAFLDQLMHRLGRSMYFLRLSDRMTWVEAAQLLNECCCFVGCLSAYHVLAHGLGKRVLVFEPNEDRRVRNYQVFRCNYGTEIMPDPNDLDAFVRTLEMWAADAH